MGTRLPAPARKFPHASVHACMLLRQPLHSSSLLVVDLKRRCHGERKDLCLGVAMSPWHHISCESKSKPNIISPTKPLCNFPFSPIRPSEGDIAEDRVIS